MSGGLSGAIAMKTPDCSLTSNHQLLKDPQLGLELDDQVLMTTPICAEICVPLILGKLNAYSPIPCGHTEAYALDSITSFPFLFTNKYHH